MKRLLSLTLSILLLLSFTACGTSTRCANCQCEGCGCECTTSSDKSKENVDASSNNENSYDSTVSSSTTEPEDKLPTTSEENVTISDKEENNYSNNTNSNSTPDLSDNFKETIYNDAKQMYLSGEWDGSPTTLYGQNIELTTPPDCLLINGKIVYNHYRVENWDLPENWDSLNIQAVGRYTPDIGVFAIQDNTLVRYVRGKNIIHEGGSFDWEGLDVTHPEEFGCTILDEYTLILPDSSDRQLLFYKPYLYYYERADVLLLVTTDPITNMQYLYTFPDYNVSKIKFLGRIWDFAVWGASYSLDTFYYLSNNLVTWRWSEDGPVVDEDCTLFSYYLSN